MILPGVDRTLLFRDERKNLQPSCTKKEAKYSCVNNLAYDSAACKAIIETEVSHMKIIDGINVLEIFHYVSN